MSSKPKLDKAQRMERIRKIAPLLSLAILIIGALAVELGAVAVIKINGSKVRPFLLNWGTKSQSHPELDLSYNRVDPILGYAHDPALHADKLKRVPGFVVYEPKKDLKAPPRRIFTLGGSTTDPLILQNAPSIGPDNWPKLLRDQCNDHETACQVYNGGVGGFSSSQELFKLIRDVTPLDPDVVISLNGVNETYHCQDTDHPLVNSYTIDLMHSIFDADNPKHGRTYVDPFLFPNTMYLVRHFKVRYFTDDGKGDDRAYFGVKNIKSPAQVWETNVRMMHGIAKSMGFEYQVFLQPLIGFGQYTPNETERSWGPESGKDPNYWSCVTQVFSAARKICREELDFCTDITDVFANHGSGLYHDNRHPNAKGNRIMAEAIFKDLRLRQLVQVPQQNISMSAN